MVKRRSQRKGDVHTPSETLRLSRMARFAFYTHPGTSAETRLLTIAQRNRNCPVTLAQALERLSDKSTMLLVNNVRPEMDPWRRRKVSGSTDPPRRSRSFLK